jgi:hypothetical protein
LTVETWKRKSDGKLAEVKPIDPHRGRRSSLTRTGFLRVRLEGQKSWSSFHPTYLAEHFERVDG